MVADEAPGGRGGLVRELRVGDLVDMGGGKFFEVLETGPRFRVRFVVPEGERVEHRRAIDRAPPQTA